MQTHPLPMVGALGLVATLMANGGCLGSLEDSRDSALSDHSQAQGWQAEDKGMLTLNGLRSINGLRRFNGVLEVHGFSSNPLQNNSAYRAMTESRAGRETFGYLVKCALPAWDAIKVSGQTYLGDLGLAPEWKNENCRTDCQEKITSAMLALTNGPGHRVSVELSGEAPLGYEHVMKKI